MSKILNQETRLTLQQRRILERELDALAKANGLDLAELEAKEDQLRQAQASIDQLQKQLSEVQSELDQQPEVVYRSETPGIVGMISSITVFLIAICVIGVTSLTLNSQSILIDNLISQINQLRFASARSTMILAPRAPRRALEPLDLAMLNPRNHTGAPIAMSVWNDPNDANTAPYSELVKPRTRNEAMQVALARAKKH